MQININAKDFLSLLLTEAGFSSSNFVLDDSIQGTIGFIAPYGKMAGTLIKEIVEAEGGVFFFDEQGIGRFWNRLHFSINSGSVGTLNYSNIMDLQYKDTPIINYVRVITQPRAVTANQLIYRLAQATEILPGVTAELIFSFKDDDGDLPVTSIDAPVYVDNQVTSFYRTNQESDGSGDPLSANITLDSFTTWGTGGKAVFTNVSPGTTMYITDLQLYGTPAKVVTTIVEEYYDQDSIDDYGINPDNSGVVMEITNNYIQSKASAQSTAFNIVDTFKEPGRQFNSVPFANPAWSFGDVFDVNIEDTGETLKMVMLGSRLNMDRTTALSQEMTLEERVFRTYFQISVSEIGGPDVIAV